MDTDTLNTLPEREFRAGLAEVIKYAMIMDAGFFLWLEQHSAELLQRESQALTHMIQTCVRHKARVVAEDVHEHGRRALLNFGHTFAHALESQTAYTYWLHGEAVAIGMHMAALFAQQAGMLESDCVIRQLRLLQRYGLELTLPQ
jgi:3-dehydroquinate synthase